MAETNTPPSAPQMPPVDPKKLVDTAVAVLKNPTEFYKGIKAETGFQKCLIFSIAMGVIYGVLAFCSSLLWLSIHVGFGFAIAAAVTALITGVISGAIGPFIGGIIIWAICLAFGSKATWEPSVKIAAYSMAVYPISALGGFVPWVGWLISLAAGCYGIYIIVMGAKVLNFDAPPAAAAPPSA
jgi:hypothetical protein